LFIIRDDAGTPPVLAISLSHFIGRRTVSANYRIRRRISGLYQEMRLGYGFGVRRVTVR